MMDECSRSLPGSAAAVPPFILPLPFSFCAARFVCENKEVGDKRRPNGRKTEAGEARTQKKLTQLHI